MIKPPRLRRNSTIAVTSLSSSTAAYVPGRVERAILALKEQGFNVVRGESLRRDYYGSAGTPEERVGELHEFFVNDGVEAILATIGGLSANEIIPLLDYELIRAHPKIFCGYSDNTLIHSALNSQCNFISFYGPGLLTQFGEYPQPSEYTTASFLRMLTDPAPLGPIMPSSCWSDEIVDWFETDEEGRARNWVDNQDAHLWIRAGSAEGQIAGGCLPSLLQLMGTKFSPNLQDKILVIDLPDGEDFRKGIPLPYVSSLLADLKMRGVFTQIVGLVIGRPFGYTTEERMLLMDIIARQTAQYRFPILVNVNLGHADPVITLPLGIMARLDSAKREFALLEGAVKH